MFNRMVELLLEDEVMKLIEYKDLIDEAQASLFEHTFEFAYEVDNEQWFIGVYSHERDELQMILPNGVPARRVCTVTRYAIFAN